jgi:hypothetical protein
VGAGQPEDGPGKGPKSCAGCAVRIVFGLVLVAIVFGPLRSCIDGDGITWEFRGVAGSPGVGDREFAVDEVIESSGRGRQLLCSNTSNYVRVRLGRVVSGDLPYGALVVLRGRVASGSVGPLAGSRELVPTGVTVIGMADGPRAVGPFPGCPPRP